MYRVSHREDIFHCKMASAAVCGEREPRQRAGGGEPYRQEERENHLGTKGAENILQEDKNTPCTACHRNPIGLYVLYCLFI